LWGLFGAVALETWADVDGTYADTGVDNPEDYGMALQGWGPGGEQNGGFYQDSPATVALEYTYSANMHFEPGFNPTTFEMKLEWRDSGGNTISQTITDLLPLTTSNNPGSPSDWATYSVTGIAPAGTTEVRTTIIFEGATDVGGLQAGRVDNVSLVAVPEPSSTALLGLGSLALLFRRRR